MGFWYVTAMLIDGGGVGGRHSLQSIWLDKNGCTFKCIVKSEFRNYLRNNKWLGQEFTVTCNYTFPDSTKPKWAVPRNSPGKPRMCSSATALPTETALHNSVISHFLTAVCIFTHFHSLITSEHAVCSHASNAFIQSNTCNGGNFPEATWGDSLSKQELCYYLLAFVRFRDWIILWNTTKRYYAEYLHCSFPYIKSESLLFLAQTDSIVNVPVSFCASPTGLRK